MKLLLTLLVFVSMSGYSQDTVAHPVIITQHGIIQHSGYRALQNENDSLKAKLRALQEYADLTCPIIANISLDTMMGKPYVRIVNRKEAVTAIEAYRKRYSNR